MSRKIVYVTSQSLLNRSLQDLFKMYIYASQLCIKTSLKKTQTIFLSSVCVSAYHLWKCRRPGLSEVTLPPSDCPRTHPNCPSDPSDLLRRSYKTRQTLTYPFVCVYCMSVCVVHTWRSESDHRSRWVRWSRGRGSASGRSHCEGRCFSCCSECNRQCLDATLL